MTPSWPLSARQARIPSVRPLLILKQMSTLLESGCRLHSISFSVVRNCWFGQKWHATDSWLCIAEKQPLTCQPAVYFRHEFTFVRYVFQWQNAIIYVPCGEWTLKSSWCGCEHSLVQSPVSVSQTRPHGQASRATVGRISYEKTEKTKRQVEIQ